MESEEACLEKGHDKQEEHGGGKLGGLLGKGARQARGAWGWKVRRLALVKRGTTQAASGPVREGVGEGTEWVGGGPGRGCIPPDIQFLTHAAPPAAAHLCPRRGRPAISQKGSTCSSRAAAAPWAQAGAWARALPSPRLQEEEKKALTLEISA
jgi:hypothetical protein